MLNKKIAVITDIHGNLEALESIITNIKKEKVDDIICLGDTISIGPNSKECIDLLIDNNIKMTLGNHELYILRGTDIESSIEGAEKEHYKWVKENLTDKELAYISNCPLYYEYTITYDKTMEDYKLIFSHYLFNDINADNLFECTKLNKDINLWIKHNMERKEHIIGHLHSSFNVNDIDGINGDYISSTGELANITVVDSVGCTKGNQTSYLLINIGKSIEKRRVILEYDRRKFEKKILSMDFPVKQNILKYFYGIEL